MRKQLSQNTQNTQDDEIEIAEREAYLEANVLQGDDFVIRACDGDDEYVFLATRKRNAKSYTVLEVYPGLSKPETAARTVDGKGELIVPGRYPGIRDVVEMLNELLFEDFDLQPTPAVHLVHVRSGVRQLRASNTTH